MQEVKKFMKACSQNSWTSGHKLNERFPKHNVGVLTDRLNVVLGNISLYVISLIIFVFVTFTVSMSFNSDHTSHVTDMGQEDAYELMKKCVREIHKRLIVNLPNFKVQLIDKNGIRDLPPITAKNLAVEEANVPLPEVRAI
jgi:hypothetical protein